MKTESHRFSFKTKRYVGFLLALLLLLGNLLPLGMFDPVTVSAEGTLENPKIEGKPRRSTSTLRVNTQFVGIVDRDYNGTSYKALRFDTLAQFKFNPLDLYKGTYHVQIPPQFNEHILAVESNGYAGNLRTWVYDEATNSYSVPIMYLDDGLFSQTWIGANPNYTETYIILKIEDQPDIDNEWDELRNTLQEKHGDVATFDFYSRFKNGDIITNMTNNTTIPLDKNIVDALQKTRNRAGKHIRDNFMANAMMNIPRDGLDMDNDILYVQLYWHLTPFVTYNTSMGNKPYILVFQVEPAMAKYVESFEVDRLFLFGTRTIPVGSTPGASPENAKFADTGKAYINVFDEDSLSHLDSPKRMWSRNLAGSYPFEMMVRVKLKNPYDSSKPVEYVQLISDATQNTNSKFVFTSYMKSCMTEAELNSRNGTTEDNGVVLNTYSSAYYPLNDSDGDGLVDIYEQYNSFTDYKDPDKDPDSDGDGKQDKEEIFVHKTDPNVAPPEVKDIVYTQKVLTLETKPYRLVELYRKNPSGDDELLLTERADVDGRVDFDLESLKGDKQIESGQELYVKVYTDEETKSMIDDALDNDETLPIRQTRVYPNPEVSEPIHVQNSATIIGEGNAFFEMGERVPADSIYYEDGSGKKHRQYCITVNIKDNNYKFSDQLTIRLYREDGTYIPDSEQTLQVKFNDKLQYDYTDLIMSGVIADQEEVLVTGQLTRKDQSPEMETPIQGENPDSSAQPVVVKGRLNPPEVEIDFSKCIVNDNTWYYKKIDVKTEYKSEDERYNLFIRVGHHSYFGDKDGRKTIYPDNYDLAVKGHLGLANQPGFGYWATNTEDYFEFNGIKGKIFLDGRTDPSEKFLDADGEFHGHPGKSSFLDIYAGQFISVYVLDETTGRFSQPTVIVAPPYFDKDNITAIKVTKKPDKLNYDPYNQELVDGSLPQGTDNREDPSVKEHIDLTGTVLTITDNNKVSIDITPEEFATYGIDYEVFDVTTDYEHFTESAFKLKFKHEMKAISSDTVDMKINPRAFDHDNIREMSLVTPPGKLTYAVGETLNLQGMKVNLYDAAGMSIEILADELPQYGINPDTHYSGNGIYEPFEPIDELESPITFRYKDTERKPEDHNYIKNSEDHPVTFDVIVASPSVEPVVDDNLTTNSTEINVEVPDGTGPGKMHVYIYQDATDDAPEGYRKVEADLQEDGTYQADVSGLTLTEGTEVYAEFEERIGETETYKPATRSESVYIGLETSPTPINPRYSEDKTKILADLPADATVSADGPHLVYLLDENGMSVRDADGQLITGTVENVDGKPQLQIPTDNLPDDFSTGRIVFKDGTKLSAESEEIAVEPTPMPELSFEDDAETTKLNVKLPEAFAAGDTLTIAVPDPTEGVKYIDLTIDATLINEDGSVTVDLESKLDDADVVTATAKQKFHDHSPEAKVTYHSAEAVVGPFDPKDPNKPEKPEGFDTFNYVAGDNGTFPEGAKTAYYINLSSEVTFGSLTPPHVLPNDGYTHTGWDKEPDFVIDEENLEATAQYALSIIGPKPKEMHPLLEDEIPDNYVKVSFAKGKHGSFEDPETASQVYFVSPDGSVKVGSIEKPAIVPNQDYVHSGWNKADNFVITKNVVLTAQYTKSQASQNEPTAKDIVIGKDAAELPPAGNGIANKDDLPDETEFTYKEGTDVDLSTPGTTDVTIVVTYPDGSSEEVQTKVIVKDAIIGPVDPEDHEEIPEDYVKVLFVAGENGSLEGDTAYFVDPGKAIKLGNSSIIKPGTVAADNYIFDGWDKSDDTTIPAEGLTVTAIFTKAEDVIGPVDPENPGKIPENYVKVSFDAGKNGDFANADQGKKVYYVNPDGSVTVEDLVKPEIKATDGFVHDGWSMEDSAAITAEVTLTAQYKASQASQYSPKGQTITVNKEETPNAEDGIKNKDELPQDGVTYEFKESVDTSTYGNKEAIVVVTYPDESIDEVEITVHVNSDADNNPPALPEDKVPVDSLDQLTNEEKKQVEDAIKAANPELFDEAETEATVTVDNTGKATITYPDGSTNEISSDDLVREKKDNERYSPDGKTMAVGKGSPVPDAQDGIENANDLPEGTTFTYKETPSEDSMATPGEIPVVIVVEYPDGSKENVNSKIIVTDSVIGPKPEDATTAEADVPDNFVKVAFIAGDGGTIDTTKSVYFVDPEKITKLGDVTDEKPQVTPQDDYVFTGWDEDDDKAISETGLTVTALFEPAEKIIGPKPEGHDQTKDPTVPPNYLRIEFVAGEHGTVDPTTSVIYVKPGTVTFDELDKPATTPADGYLFTQWTPESADPIADAQIFTAVFERAGRIIGPKAEDDTTDVPANYFKVALQPGDHGRFAEGTETVFFVDPEAAKPVTFSEILNLFDTDNVQPQNGFTHLGWTVDETQEINSNLTAYATYTPPKSIIGPVEDSQETPEDIPTEYVKVSFSAEGKGELSSDKVYYVDPTAKVTVGQITKPTVTPNDGYEFRGWDQEANVEITEALELKAQYKEPKLIIGPRPETTVNEPGDDIPENYLKVTFKPGTNGAIESDATYFVAPDAITFDYLAEKVNVTPSTGYVFSDWDKSDLTESDGKISDGGEAIAQYTELASVYGPKAPGDNTEKYPGYLTVKVTAGEYGTFMEGAFAPGELPVDDKEVYYFVKPGTNITEITLPGTDKIKPITSSEETYTVHNTQPWFYSDGRSEHSETVDTDLVITVHYTPLPPIFGPVPENYEFSEEEASQIENYIQVVFDAGDQGSLQSDGVYYVVINPLKNIFFGELKSVPIVNPKTGYRFRAWTIDNNDVSDTTVINEEPPAQNQVLTIQARYDELSDIIAESELSGTATPPQGYVKVTFSAGDHGAFSSVGDTIFYVNPAKTTYGALLADARIPQNDQVQPDANYLRADQPWSVGEAESETKISESMTITAQYKKKMSALYEPVAGEITVEKNHSLDEEDAKQSVSNFADFAEDVSEISFVGSPDTSKYGYITDPNPVVRITYKDGTSVDITVKVYVKSDADNNNPKGQSITVDKGETPEAENAISNKDNLPQDTTYTFEPDVDTSTGGDKETTVVVEYPDGSTDKVSVTVHVNFDNEKYKAQGGEIEVNRKQQLTEEDAKTAINNAKTLPEGTTYAFKSPVDTSTGGSKRAVVVVTYPDETKEEVQVTVKVKSDKEMYEPVSTVVTVNKGETPDPSAAISNKDELPKGTTYAFEPEPDTETSGDEPVTVIVTYPDGTEDTVETTVHVTSDKEQYDPEGGTITVDKEHKLTAKDAAAAITNTETLPEGTNYAFDPDQLPDTTEKGDKDAWVIVTYPDGTSETVKVTVHVKSDAEMITPEGGTVNVDKGSEPGSAEAKKAIRNADKMPEGTTYSFEEEITTNTSGDQEAVVIVSYPDGSKDEVSVTVHVNFDNEQYKPVGKDLTVDKNVTVNAKDAIGNTDKLPSDASYAFKKPISTATSGKKYATVVVTYQDGTKDEVSVTITVRTDAEQYDPNLPDEKVPVKDPTKLTPEEKAEVEQKIRDANTEPALPDGTQIDVADDGTTTITYPDGTSEEAIPGADLVEKKPDKDIYDPQAPDEKIPVANTDSLTDAEKDQVKEAIETKNQDLPEGTEITVDDDGTVTITYPDKTKDTISGDNTVTKKTEAENYDGSGTATIGATENLTEDDLVFEPQLPEGAEIGDLPAVDTSTPGDKTIDVPVTFEDGSTKDVPVTVTVKDQNELYDPQAPDEKIPVTDANSLTDAEKDQVKEAIETKNPNLPDGTEITVGDDGTVTITYPDETVDTISGDSTVTKKPDKDIYDPQAPDEKIPVDDTNSLTDAEKDQVKEAIETKNPNLPEGTTIEVGDDGTVTITYPDETVDTISGDETVTKKPDKDIYDPQAPDEKIPVADADSLTDAEKNQVKEAIEDKNPELPEGTTIEVGDNGTVTITYPDETVDTISGDETVTKKPDKDIYDPQAPDEKIPVANTDSLTDEEKDQVKEAIEDKNPNLPEGTEIEVGDDGTVTITYPDETVDTISGENTVTKKPDKDIYDPQAPAEKIPVTDTDHLTDEEKDQVKEAIETKNPNLPEGTKIEVGDDGTVTITYPDKTKDTIPGDEIVTKKDDKDIYDPQAPDEKIPVADTDHLTDAEKDQVKEAIETKNPNLPEGTTIEVGDDGTVTITYPDKTVDTISGDDTVTKKPDKDIYDPQAPDEKIPVANTDSLTDAEKDQVKEAIETKNPNLPEGTTIEVGDDGTVTITYPDKTVDTISGDDTVTKKPDKDIYDPQAPDEKIPVANTDSLTDAEKDQVKEAIETKNPNLPDGTTIEVGDDGTVTITYPDGTEDTISGDEIVTGKSDNEKYEPIGQDIDVKEGSTPNAADAIANKDDLPADTQYAFEEEVDTSTPGEKEATVIVTYPDQTTDKVTVKVNVTKKPDKDIYDPQAPDEKIPVADADHLTDEEKDQVKEAIETKNPDLPDGTEITVGDDGTVTITYPDETVDTISGDEIVTKKDDKDIYDPQTPDEKIPVADADSLTEAEKDQVKEAIETKNPDLPEGTEITVGDDGTVTITYPDETTMTIPGEAIVIQTIIGPFDPNTPPQKPEGYVQVTFVAGNHGTYDANAKSVLYISKVSKTTFGAAKGHAPEPTADAGYLFRCWDIRDDFVIDQDVTATAQYLEQLVRKDGLLVNEIVAKTTDEVSEDTAEEAVAVKAQEEDKGLPEGLDFTEEIVDTSTLPDQEGTNETKVTLKGTYTFQESQKTMDVTWDIYVPVEIQDDEDFRLKTYGDIRTAAAQDLTPKEIIDLTDAVSLSESGEEGILVVDPENITHNQDDLARINKQKQAMKEQALKGEEVPSYSDYVTVTYQLSKEANDNIAADLTKAEKLNVQEDKINRKINTQFETTFNKDSVREEVKAFVKGQLPEDASITEESVVVTEEEPKQIIVTLTFNDDSELEFKMNYADVVIPEKVGPFDPANAEDNRPQKDGDKYDLVKFEAGENGSFGDDGTQAIAYFVHSEAGINYLDLAPEVTANEGYQLKTGEDAWKQTQDSDGITFTAQYEPVRGGVTHIVTFTIDENLTFITDATLTTMEIEVADGTFWADLDLPDVQAAEGYTFTGWQPDENVVDGQIVGDVIATAQYSEAQMSYTITFDAGDGTAGFLTDPAQATLTDVAAGTLWDSLPLPDVTVNDGYTFMGWQPDANVVDGQIVGDVIATAQYTKAQTSFTITFDAGTAGILADPAQATLTDVAARTLWDSLTLPEVTVNDGYTFMGWQPDENVVDGQIVGDVIATAQYTEAQTIYTIIFDAGEGTFEDGSKEKAVSSAPGALSEIAPAVISPDGFLFNGWVLSEGSAIDEDGMITGDAVFTASFVPDTTGGGGDSDEIPIAVSVKNPEGPTTVTRSIKVPILILPIEPVEDNTPAQLPDEGEEPGGETGDETEEPTEPEEPDDEPTIAEQFRLMAPHPRVRVSDPNNLSDAEKDLVKAAILRQNPNLPEGSVISVAADGTVTVEYQDGSQAVLDGSVTVERDTRDWRYYDGGVIKLPLTQTPTDSHKATSDSSSGTPALPATDGSVATQIPAVGEDPSVAWSTACLLLMAAGALLILRRKR